MTSLGGGELEQHGLNLSQRGSCGSLRFGCVWTKSKGLIISSVLSPKSDFTENRFILATVEPHHTCVSFFCFTRQDTTNETIRLKLILKCIFGELFRNFLLEYSIMPTRNCFAFVFMVTAGN